MRIVLLPLIPVVLVSAACNRRQEEGETSSNKVEARAPKANDVDSNASIMRPEVAEEAGVAQPPPPEQPLQATISFADGGGKLDDAGKKAIDALVADPRFAGAGQITVTGHTDSEGSDEANLSVSRRRAETVRDYLVSKGVPAERLNVIAMGERRPVQPNANPDGTDFPEGRARNRRVEIDVAPRPTGPASPEAPRDAGA